MKYCKHIWESSDLWKHCLICDKWSAKIVFYHKKKNVKCIKEKRYEKRAI